MPHALHTAPPAQRGTRTQAPPQRRDQSRSPGSRNPTFPLQNTMPPRDLVLRAYLDSVEPGGDWLRYSGFSPKLKLLLTNGVSNLVFVGGVLLLPADVLGQNRVPILLFVEVASLVLSAITFLPIIRPIRRAAREIRRASEGVRSTQEEVLKMATDQGMANTLLAGATDGVIRNFQSVASGAQDVGSACADASYQLAELARFVDALIKQQRQSGSGYEDASMLQQPIAQLYRSLSTAYHAAMNLLRNVQENLATERLLRVQESGVDVTDQLQQTERRIQESLRSLESIQKAEQDLLS